MDRRILGDPPPEPTPPVSPDVFAAAIDEFFGPRRMPVVPVFVDEPDVDLVVSDGDAAWMQEYQDRLLTDLWYGGRVA